MPSTQYCSVISPHITLPPKKRSIKGKNIFTFDLP
jgi:hypothetical protein